MRVGSHKGSITQENALLAFRLPFLFQRENQHGDAVIQSAAEKIGDSGLSLHHEFNGRFKH